MICTNCIKKDVCKHKEDCIKFEESAKAIGQSADCNFSVEIKCKHKNIGQSIRNPLTDKYPHPDTYPHQPLKRTPITWRSDRTDCPPPEYK